VYNPYCAVSGNAGSGRLWPALAGFAILLYGRLWPTGPTGPYWALLVYMGHRALLGHTGPYWSTLAIGPYWAILGPTD